MRFSPLSAHTYIDFRKAFAEALLPDSIAILHSNDKYPSNADQFFPFRQNKDLLRLCGIYQEETALAFFPHHPLDKNREILFIKRNDEHHQTWDGNLITKEQARNISGIQSIYWFDEFESVVYPLIPRAKTIYLNSNEKAHYPQYIHGRNERLGKKLREQFPLHAIERIQPILRSQTMLKHDEELDQLKKAIEITGNTWQKIQKLIAPGVNENDLAAEIEYEYSKAGAIPAFESIVASGKNGCILHYTQNHNQLNKDDLILIDMGAEINGYAADMTRTVAVDGTMSKRQFEVYDQVVSLYQYATDFIKPGITLHELNEYMKEPLAHALAQLGLIYSEEIKTKKNLTKFLPHGISHFLGMDVHDYGDKYTELKPGMVITCEPGIYIKEEGIGIRLENDLLITEHGNKNLMDKWEL